MQTLKQLLCRLIDANIEFVIIGGFAGVLHGSSYVTQDLDICAVLTEANIRRLREVLKDLHPLHRMTPQKLSFLEVPPDDASPIHNLYLNTDLGTIDILSTVFGVGDYERLKSKAATIPFGDKTCLLMNLEDLIKAKEALGREKDLLAAKELRAIADARATAPET